MNYQDPSLVKQVAKWAMLEAQQVSTGLPVSNRKWIEAGNNEFHRRPFKPWDERANHYQLNILLEAVEDAGLWGDLYENMAFQMADGQHLRIYDFIVADPSDWWKAIVDTLIEAEEIEFPDEWTGDYPHLKDTRPESMREDDEQQSGHPN